MAPYYNGVSCIPATFWSKPDSWISTDACLTCGGGYFNGEFFHFDFSETLMAKDKHINQFELFILWKAVELWGEKLIRKNILIYCDNKTTVDCLRAESSRNSFSQVCICNIMHVVAIKDFQVWPIHIKGINNHINDCLSRWNLGEKYKLQFQRLTKDKTTVERMKNDTEFVNLY